MFTSHISNKEYNLSEKVSAKSLRKPIMEIIQKRYPLFNIDSELSISELNEFRQIYIDKKLKDEIKQLGDLKKSIVSTVGNSAVNVELEESSISDNFTFGQKLADKVATFGGSWTFIIIFGIFIFIWIIINAVFLFNKSFDPYPFILLNLILSCMGSIQAPVIMMSQNRQEEKDRDRAKKDYLINLKSEIEIRTLHEKIDHLIINQQQELFEIQQIQIEMMKDILTYLEPKSKD